MKPIYIDITNIPELDHYTGISRVVTELIIRMLGQGMPLCLLSYSEKDKAYRMIDSEKFLLALQGKGADKKDCYTDKLLAVKDFEHGSTFLDINSTWHTLPNRSSLLPQLKNMQIRILVQIYDLIPIRFPQYMVGQTLLRFMEFLTAHLTYADGILVNTHAVEEDVKALFKELDIPEKPISILPLGADFTVSESAKDKGETDTETLAKLEGRRFLLTVGTVEPRKNHKVLYEAYEKYLADSDIDVVIVGRIGWGTEELVEKIRSNPKFGKGIYLLSGVTDATLDELYKRAFMVVFASYTEGYGLPTIESLIKGVPVVCSDIPVMREVGGEHADYFPPDDAKALADIVKRYASDSAIYEQKRSSLKTSYRPPQWDKAAEVMQQLISQPDAAPKYEHRPVKQIVFLSARPAPLLATLPYIEEFMPFLQELVVCCPDDMADFMQRRYKGRLKLTTITDPQLLSGRKLPPDHSTRNFFLRCLAMDQEAIDDEFIMCDDDYRPLRPITEEVFYENGRYKGYYFSDISGWKYQISALFSYDFCHFRTLRFLKAHGYPSLQYSSHQPQLINKKWYREMLAKYPDIMNKGYDEWSTYFNYCSAVHRDQYQPMPYVTLSWPPVGGEHTGVIPSDYIFENFYDDNYSTTRPFCGLSRGFSDKEKVLAENAKKLEIERGFCDIERKNRSDRDKYFSDYEKQYCEQPQFAVYLGEEADCVPELGVPRRLTMSRSQLNVLFMGVARTDKCEGNLLDLLVELHIINSQGVIIFKAYPSISSQLEYTRFAVKIPNVPENEQLRFCLAVHLNCRANRVEKIIPIDLID